MIRLREATKADLRSLFELDQACFPADIAYSLSEFRSILNSPRTITTIAEEGENLAGFAAAQMVRGRGSLAGHIVTIDVAPDFRRRGVGRLLMEAIEAALRAAGAELLRLEVAENNQPALSFYTELGFAAVGRLPDYYHGSLDAIVMEKPLAS